MYFRIWRLVVFGGVASCESKRIARYGVGQNWKRCEFCQSRSGTFASNGQLRYLWQYW